MVIYKNYVGHCYVLLYSNIGLQIPSRDSVAPLSLSRRVSSQQRHVLPVRIPPELPPPGVLSIRDPLTPARPGLYLFELLSDGGI